VLERSGYKIISEHKGTFTLFSDGEAKTAILYTKDWTQIKTAYLYLDKRGLGPRVFRGVDLSRDKGLIILETSLPFSLNNLSEPKSYTSFQRFLEKINNAKYAKFSVNRLRQRINGDIYILPTKEELMNIGV
jgi:hypothetical protein